MYSCCKSLPLDLIMSQINPIRTLTFDILKIDLNGNIDLLTSLVVVKGGGVRFVFKLFEAGISPGSRGGLPT